MSGKRAIAPRSVSRMQLPSVQDATTNRAFDVISEAVSALQSRQASVLVFSDLVVGVNKIVHGLGRKCVGYNLTPTTANATFAHALDKTNPRPDKEVWITVVGVGQTAATIEVF